MCQRDHACVGGGYPPANGPRSGAVGEIGSTRSPSHRRISHPATAATKTVRAAPREAIDRLDVVLGVFLKRLGAILAAEVVRLAFIFDRRSGVGLLHNHPAHGILGCHVSASLD